MINQMHLSRSFTALVGVGALAAVTAAVSVFTPTGPLAEIGFGVFVASMALAHFGRDYSRPRRALRLPAAPLLPANEAFAHTLSSATWPTALAAAGQPRQPARRAFRAPSLR